MMADVEEASKEKEEEKGKPYFSVMLVNREGDVTMVALDVLPARILLIQNLGLVFEFSNMTNDAKGQPNFVYKEAPCVSLNITEKANAID